MWLRCLLSDWFFSEGYVRLMSEREQILSTVYQTLSVEMNFRTFYQLEPGHVFSSGNSLDTESIEGSKIQYRSDLS